MTLAEIHLQRERSALGAYNALQIALMRRFVAGGGTAELWCTRYAAAFRQRYGWMLGPGR